MGCIREPVVTRLIVLSCMSTASAISFRIIGLIFEYHIQEIELSFYNFGTYSYHCIISLSIALVNHFASPNFSLMKSFSFCSITLDVISLAYLLSTFTSGSVELILTLPPNHFQSYERIDRAHVLELFAPQILNQVSDQEILSF